MNGVQWRWAGSGVLFDMDGTLVDSGGSVLRAWRWVAEQLDRPFSAFVPYLHGIPAGQVLDTVLPSLSANRRDELVSSMLGRQCSDVFDVTAVPGALAALDALPTARWAVVTSATRELAIARMQSAGLPLPRVLITAELTELGKPAPEPFLLAAARLGFEAGRCLVVEDSPAGVSAGRASGAPVLGVLTSAASLDGVLHQVADLSEVEFAADRGGVLVIAAAR